MNRVILMGRLTRDPDIRWTQGQDQKCMARFTLAADRRVRRDAGENQQTADFPSCIAFGKTAEWMEKYVHQGTKLAITGRIQTGSYTNRDGQKVYTTDVVVEEAEFAESKNASGSGQRNGDYQNRNDGSGQQYTESSVGDGFMDIPDGVEDEGLPFG